jgi:hypothetical protein
MRALRKSDLKTQIRQEAKEKIRPTSSNVGADRNYRQQVESGRSLLNAKASEGGDNKSKQAKQELMYLLNNYLPSYDNRIEQLIDIWRRSGDPSYNPAVRAQLRRARMEYGKKGSAI